jgi:hypothetical protein
VEALDASAAALVAAMNWRRLSRGELFMNGGVAARGEMEGRRTGLLCIRDDVFMC